jgi:phosphoadenosine phosphosulfate reductase
MNGLIDDLNKELSGKEIVLQLQYIADKFPGEVIFSTSFGLEDQALTHIIASNNIPIKIFTLDTGRMFPETYSTWNRTVEKYHFLIAAYYPEANSLQEFVSKKGPNSFYESVENRKQCCFIRKVEPLQRALKGNKIWITGIRAEQSNDRQDRPLVEWDEVNQIIKIHPLLNWTWGQVKQFVSKNDVPYNPLHDKGFVSIGCAPCTRATKPGEDFRAGRWWWEDSSKKECGLHIHSSEMENLRESNS